MSSSNTSNAEIQIVRQIRDLEPTITAEGRYIVTYDLPSEHRTILEGSQTALKKTANLRYSCGQKLHKLGLQATQSQIFVAPSMNDKIAETKVFVINGYRFLQNTLTNEVPDLQFRPLVVVSPLQGEIQLGQFTYLVQQSLLNKIDEAFMRVNGTIDAMENGELNQAQIQRLHYRLPEDVAEFTTVQAQAQQFGIDTRNVAELIRLLETARSTAGRLVA